MNDTDQFEVSCPRCQKRQRVPRDQAGKRVPCSNPSCRTPIEIAAPNAPPERVAVRHALLRSLAWCFILLGVLSLLWSAAGLAFVLSRAFSPERPWLEVLLGSGAVLLGLVTGVSCLATTEFIKLAIDLEARIRPPQPTAPAE
jgi:hypothetical protein